MNSAVDRRWAVLAVVSVAQFLTVLDLWVANIALPTAAVSMPGIQQRSRVSMVAGTSGTGVSGSAATACSRRRKPTSSSSGVKQVKVE
jgi:hypothetical protein